MARHAHVLPAPASPPGSIRTDAYPFAPVDATICTA